MREFSLDLKVVFLEEKNYCYDFENVVRKYFENKGYKVEHTGPFNDKGIPDFKISNELETFYVEAKKHPDYLRGHQLRWMCEHPENKYILVVERPKRKVVSWEESYAIYCSRNRNHNL